MTNAPADDGPWFRAVLDAESVAPGASSVVVVDSALTTRSGAPWTVMVNDFDPANTGVPLSVAVAVTVNVPTWAVVGVQLKTPVVGSIDAPAGGLVRP